MEAIERNIISMDWITLVILLSLTLLVVARNFYAMRFGDFVMLFATNKYIMLKGKDYNIYHPFNIILFIFNILTVSLFIFILYTHFFTVSKTPFLLFLQIATAYAFIILVKFSIEKILSNVFSIDEMVDRYLFHKLVYRNFLALLLFPVCLVYLYAWAPTSLAINISIGIVLLVNAVILLSFYFKNQKEIFSRWFYFIVYLCALEIAPYIILYKLFMS